MAVKFFKEKCEKAARLDLFLREKIPVFLGKSEGELSNSKIRRLIVAGAVSVNGRQIRIPGYDLHAGSMVCVELDEEKFFFEKQPDDIHFELTQKDVLFEDEYIILVNKPAFFPTEATIVGNRDNLHDAVVRYLWAKNPSLRNPPYAGIMHRLDRETSGVILFTKQRTVNAAVHAMFDSSEENHEARKIYQAVCVVKNSKRYKENQTFSVEMFMGRTSAKSQAAKWGSLSESRGGVFSHTDFTVLRQEEKNGRSLLFVEARPLTGRTHQIRVHLASLGLPILGDELYGAPDSERIMLHAKSLSFVHPVSGTQMQIQAPLPSKF